VEAEIIDKIMSDKKTKTEKGYQPKDKLDTSNPPKKEKEQYTFTKDEMNKIHQEMKDLKDLYDSEAKQNKVLTKKNNELQAEVLELQNLAKDVNEELKGNAHDHNEEIVELNMDIEMGNTQVTEMDNQITMLKDIVDKLIKHR